MIAALDWVGLVIRIDQIDVYKFGFGTEVTDAIGEQFHEHSSGDDGSLKFQPNFQGTYAQNIARLPSAAFEIVRCATLQDLATKTNILIWCRTYSFVGDSNDFFQWASLTIQVLDEGAGCPLVSEPSRGEIPAVFYAGGRFKFFADPIAGVDVADAWFP